jgi:hypothetical protein
MVNIVIWLARNVIQQETGLGDWVDQRLKGVEGM